MSTQTLFLLDAYALIYKSYYAFIRRPIYNSKGLNTSAMFGFTNILLEVLTNKNPSHIAVAFDPPTLTFRHDMYPEYKANREATPEDIKKSLPWIKDIIKGFNIQILEVEKFEADDVIGTIAKQAEREEFQVYMMTPDKDYGQLVSDNIFMYKPKHSGNDAELLGVQEINNLYGLKRPIQVIDILALHGDSSDNIPGAKGIGEKTAQKLVKEFESVENLLSNTDKLTGKLKATVEASRDNILMSKQLATINLEAPIRFDAETCKRTEPNKEALKRIFDELEFRSFTKRLFENEAPTQATPVKPSHGQQSLFGAEESTIEEIAPKNQRTLSDVSHNYVIADNELKIQQLIKTLSNAPEFCFDTETTALDVLSAELVGISFSLQAHEAYYVPVPAEQEKAQELMNNFKPIFANTSIRKIGQNMKFDIQILKRYDIVVYGELFDTMIAHYLLQPELRHNLNYLSETYLEYSPIPIEKLIGEKGKGQKNMREVEIATISEYACEDADTTYQLKEVFQEMILKEDLQTLAGTIEMPLITVLADMERIGVTIDEHALHEYSVFLNEEILKLRQGIYDLAGMEFNISSPKQLGEVLFDTLHIDDAAKKTKTQQYSTSEEILVKLADKHPIINKILSYRSYTKLLSTYVDALPRLVNQKTGKIHTTFNQAIVSTGRLSSQNPNMQNIPVKEAEGREVRKAFVPSDKEHVLLSADYSQIELRIMAHLSEDENMIEAFSSGLDIHTATAAKIFKVKPEEVNREQRTKAKTANFGIIYGISAFGLAQRLNVSRGEAKALIDGYFSTYSKVAEYMTNAVIHARAKGYVETIYKRRRYLKDINSRNAVVRGFAERNAINAPIQGSAADIIKLAMIQVYETLKKENLRSNMILQVHDELVFDVFKPETERIKVIVKDAMEHICVLKVPLVVDIGIGQNWLEAH